MFDLSSNQCIVQSRPMFVVSNFLSTLIIIVYRYLAHFFLLSFIYVFERKRDREMYGKDIQRERSCLHSLLHRWLQQAGLGQAKTGSLELLFVSMSGRGSLCCLHRHISARLEVIRDVGFTGGTLTLCATNTRPTQ